MGARQGAHLAAYAAAARATLKGRASQAFDERADFSGMTKRDRLYIAKAKQKAFVSVDEQGTEASAATGMLAEAVSAAPPATPFVVDRPFLFVIRDRPTGAVLFSGRVTDASR